MNFTNKKRMIFFGCSFTSGHEIIDHELLGVSFDQCNLMKQQHLAKKRSVGEFDTFIKHSANITNDEYNERSSKRSYAAKLANRLGLEHVNYAEPGLSIEHSVLKLFDAFYSGKIDPVTDIIFLGLTTPHRYLYFTKYGIPITKVMGHLNYTPEDLHYNDYKIMQSYYFSVENFKNFCNLHAFDFILQPIVNKGLLLTGVVKPEYEMFMSIDSNWKYLEMFKQMLYDSLKYSIDENETLVSKYRPEIHGVCGFKHPPKLHINFLQRRYMIKSLIQAIKTYMAKRRHIKRIKELRKLDPFIYD